MIEFPVYLARGMDARTEDDIIAEEEKYRKLLSPIGGVITNPFRKKAESIVGDAWSVVEQDFQRLDASNVVLADLSLPDYQYFGCIFEIVHAANSDIPVVLVIGERDFNTRVYSHAFCDFITREASEAVDYIRRVLTQTGIEAQMSEMHAWYSEIARKYGDSSVRTHKRNPDETRSFEAERVELRELMKHNARGDVCQIGIGTGDWTRTICETADRVVGVEQSEEMLVEARRNLSCFSNISFLRANALKDDITGGPFDCVVIYFLLSILPPSKQNELLDRVWHIMKPGGVLIAADTKKLGDVPAIGLGRRQLQARRSNDKLFVLYKEHFVGSGLATIFKRPGYTILHNNGPSVWFSWVVSQRTER